MRFSGLLLVLLLAVPACGRDAAPAAQEPAPAVSSAAPVASPAPKLVGCKVGPSVAFTPVTVQNLAVGIAGDGPVGVVIANTLDGYHCDWLVWADHLIKSGVRVAVFEYGSPPRMAGIPAMLEQGPKEMMAVADELRKQGAQKIVYAGGSLGGSVALATAAKPEAQAAGVVSLSGGLDGQAETVKTLTIPAIYAVAEEDTSGGAPAVAKELHKATEDSELLVYPGAQHAGGMFIDKRYADELLAKLDAFLAKV